MKRLNPDKLYVEFGAGVTETEPVIGRRYTLTHSDITADLFLDIGLQFTYEKTNEMRDEVLAEWTINNGYPYLYVYVYVDGQFDSASSAVRDTIFRRELPLALEALRYGDGVLFEAHPDLDAAQIWIHFDSAVPGLNRFESWGSFYEYKDC